MACGTQGRTSLSHISFMACTLHDWNFIACVLYRVGMGCGLWHVGLRGGHLFHTFHSWLVRYMIGILLRVCYIGWVWGVGYGMWDSGEDISFTHFIHGLYVT